MSRKKRAIPAITMTALHSNEKQDCIAVLLFAYMLLFLSVVSDAAGVGNELAECRD